MKKLFLISCLIVSISISLCGCGNKKIEDLNTADIVEAVSENTTVDEDDDYSNIVSEVVSESDAMPDAYTEILDKALCIIVDYSTGYTIEDGELGIVQSIEGFETSENLERIGYACLDIDDNGTDELIIAEKGTDSGDSILAVYTLKNDRAVLIMEGYARSRYYYLGDSLFYQEGSGGASFTYFGVYEIEDDGITISTKEYCFSGFKDESDVDSYGWFYNTTGEYSVEASEELNFSNNEEPYALMEEYRSKTYSFDLTMFSDYESEDAQENVYDSEKYITSITVFFNEDIDQASVDMIGQEIEGLDSVSSINYVSADEAWEDFSETYFDNNEDVAEEFANNQDNPLANSAHYEVYLKENVDVDTVVEHIEGVEGVRAIEVSIES